MLALDPFDDGQGPDTTWRDEAACVGQSADFVKVGSHRRDPSYDHALTVCARCPVRTECLAEALALPHEATAFAVWGGLTPRQRQRRRRGTEKPRPVTLPPDDPRHGTGPGYSTQGCRCDTCTAWARDNSRRRRAAQARKDTR